MKKVIIKRKRKFALALLTYWIITRVSKEEFVAKFNLVKDKYASDNNSSTMTKINISATDLDKIGVKISNGQTLELYMYDNVETIFVTTIDGRVTDEIVLDDFLTDEGDYKICLSTKGGFKNISYPYFKKNKQSRKFR